MKLSPPEKFGEELTLWEAGDLYPSHVFNLGLPSAALRQGGFPLQSITLTQSVLSKIIERHGLSLIDVKALPAAIQDPIFIFDSKTRIGSKVVLTEIVSRDGRHAVAAVELDKTLRGITVNDIRSVYPKDTVLVLRWIEDGWAVYADTQKSQAWLKGQAPSDSERLSALLGLKPTYLKPRRSQGESRKLGGFKR